MYGGYVYPWRESVCGWESLLIGSWGRYSVYALKGYLWIWTLEFIFVSAESGDDDRWWWSTFTMLYSVLVSVDIIWWLSTHSSLKTCRGLGLLCFTFPMYIFCTGLGKACRWDIQHCIGEMSYPRWLLPVQEGYSVGWSMSCYNMPRTGDPCISVSCRAAERLRSRCRWWRREHHDCAWSSRAASQSLGYFRLTIPSFCPRVTTLGPFSELHLPGAFIYSARTPDGQIKHIRLRL